MLLAMNAYLRAERLQTSALYVRASFDGPGADIEI